MLTDTLIDKDAPGNEGGIAPVKPHKPKQFRQSSNLMLDQCNFETAYADSQARLGQLDFHLKLEAQASATFTMRYGGRFKDRGAHRQILGCKRYQKELVVIFEDRIELT